MWLYLDIFTNNNAGWWCVLTILKNDGLHRGWETTSHEMENKSPWFETTNQCWICFFTGKKKVTYGLVDQAFSTLWFYELPVFRNTLELLAS